MSDDGYCCTPDSGDCCGPGSWCCVRAGKHSHEEESDVAVQAILALCHHQDRYFHHECEACQFRSASAIEHLQVTINAAIESLTNPYRSQA